MQRLNCHQPSSTHTSMQAGPDEYPVPRVIEIISERRVCVGRGYSGGFGILAGGVARAGRIRAVRAYLGAVASASGSANGGTHVSETEE